MDPSQVPEICPLTEELSSPAVDMGVSKHPMGIECARPGGAERERRAGIKTPLGGFEFRQVPDLVNRLELPPSIV